MITSHDFSSPVGNSNLIRQPFNLICLSLIGLLLFSGGSMADQPAVVPPDFGALKTAVSEEGADSKTAKSAEGQGNRKKQDPRSQRISKDAEKGAIEFAQQHQPAMASLVKRLRNRNPEAYDKAIRELSADAVRLTKFEERQPQRFQSELDLWKVDSEIRIQLARWTVSGSDRIEATLRGLLTKRQKLRRQRIEFERQRLQARLTAIDEQLQQPASQRAEGIDREWAKLTRRLRPANSKTTVGKKTTKDASKADAKRPDSKSMKSKSAKLDIPQDDD